MTYETIMAGFGGQGLLFSGKVLAHAALIENKELSWLPSYGPEMRGGTCNCSVIVSDDPVGSPIIAHPNVLMVMNEPSLDKFEDTVAAGGTIFVDSSLIARKVRRTDVEVVYIPATKMATEMEAKSLANMGLLLANRGQNPFSGKHILHPGYVRTLKSLMLSCGMYDESGEYGVLVGLPSKSGVGGGIVAVVSDRWGIGTYGPALNEKGNSLGGIAALQHMSHLLRLSIFA